MPQRASDFSVGETIYFKEFMTRREASAVIKEIQAEKNTLVVEPEEWVGAELAWIPLDKYTVSRFPRGDGITPADLGADP